VCRAAASWLIMVLLMIPLVPGDQCGGAEDEKSPASPRCNILCDRQGGQCERRETVTVNNVLATENKYT